MTSPPASHRHSAAFAARAARVIPGGHHLSGRVLVEGQPPLYFERARGCRVTDVDGREYVDYLLAFGAVVLGYADEEVDRAAFAQCGAGALVSLNHRRHVEFIEAMLARFPRFDMGMFMKTGSEATTAALRIARRATGRRKVVRAGYHGWHDWCLPLEAFVPEGLDRQVLEFDANDPESLRSVLAEHAGEIAAVILAPEMVLPLDRAKIAAHIELAQRAGAVFVLDEVKTGVRSPTGSIHAWLDLAPDVVTLSKAIGNGWPIAVVLGRRAVMEHAAGMHCSATYHGDTSAMAAALRTIELADQRGIAAHLDALGGRLIDGLNEAAARHGVPMLAYPEPIPAMPFFRANTPDRTLAQRLTSTFFDAVLERGALLHPRHLWFVSGAHDARDIETTLQIAGDALAQCARTVG